MVVANVDDMSSAAGNVLAFVAPADKRQAECFRALLERRWAEVADISALLNAPMSEIAVAILREQ
jgi:predicted transcriptional regulator